MTEQSAEPKKQKTLDDFALKHQKTMSQCKTFEQWKQKFISGPCNEKRFRDAFNAVNG